MIIQTIQAKVAAALVIVLMLVGIYWKGTLDGKEGEREKWQKGVEITRQAYSDAARSAFELRQQLSERANQATKEVIKEVKVYYETNPNPICLVESRSVYVREGRRDITRASGSTDTSQTDTPS